MHSKNQKLWTNADEPDTPSTDPEIERVVAAIRSADPDGSRFAATIRATYDQIYDGAHTGRFTVDQLMKTEKTHIGTLLEINLQRKFRWDDGDLYDYTIAGIDIDCKFAQRLGSWMIPPELYDNRGLALVVWASESEEQWCAGVIRTTLDVLRESTNRDLKKSLRADALHKVRWIWKEMPLPENILLHMEPSIRERILSADRERQNAGASRIRVLFRLVQHKLIDRATVVTVAQQADPMKRVRSARLPDSLGGEGIIILGGYRNHQAAAIDLGLPVPGSGSFVSAQIVSAEAEWAGNAAEFDGKRYRLATPSDTIEPAPQIPWKKSDAVGSGLE